jgi:hypothetical protein
MITSDYARIELFKAKTASFRDAGRIAATKGRLTAPVAQAEMIATLNTYSLPQ